MQRELGAFQFSYSYKGRYLCTSIYMCVYLGLYISTESRCQSVLRRRKHRRFIEKDLRLLIEYVDVDGDGVLALTEFLELMRQMRIGITASSQGPKRRSSSVFSALRCFPAVHGTVLEVRSTSLWPSMMITTAISTTPNSCGRSSPRST